VTQETQIEMNETLMAEARELDELWVRLSWTSHRRFEQELDRFNLTGPQFMALRSVHKCGNGCSMTELAGAAHQVSPTMTGIIDRLLERGLVERQRDPHDRRSLLVSLTDKGAAMLEAVAQQKRIRMAQFLAGIAPEERERIQQTLQQMLDFFAAEIVTTREEPVS